MKRRQYEQDENSLAKQAGAILALVVIMAAILWINGQGSAVSSTISGVTSNLLGGKEGAIKTSTAAIVGTTVTSSLNFDNSVGGQGTSQQSITGSSSTIVNSPNSTDGNSGLSYCGDGTCDPDETCSSCLQDCGCKVGQYCSSWGACEAQNQCGSGICTPNENSSGSCCSDCGCSGGLVCDANKEKCIAPVKYNSTLLNSTVAQYISNFTAGDSSLNFTFVQIMDDVLNGTPVEDVFLTCQYSNRTDVPCQYILVMLSNGTVLDVEQSN